MKRLFGRQLVQLKVIGGIKPGKQMWLAPLALVREAARYARINRLR